MKTLIKKYYSITEVVFSNETKIIGTTLFLSNTLAQEAYTNSPLVVSASLAIVTKDDYDVYSNSIMDVQPIAYKEQGELGHGVTNILDGVVLMLCGIDENNVQIGEFGSSEGRLSETISWNRPGAPDYGDIIIKGEIVIKAGIGMERHGPLAVHQLMDKIVKEIIKAFSDGNELVLKNEEQIVYQRELGKPKVVLIKEVMGQGAMHDNLLLPLVPGGILGSVSNIDAYNLPVALSPLEILDGGIHALKCIGPASKETTYHYFREPLIKEMLKQQDFDFVGVIVIGSPQANTDKYFVSKRLGAVVEMMDLDGAIIATEGFGNNHVDFASHHEQLGSRGLKVVGMTYAGVQGALVTGNQYMDALVDLTKAKDGMENEILADNTLTSDDALRALALLKAKFVEKTIEEAPEQWNRDVINNNQSIVKSNRE